MMGGLDAHWWWLILAAVLGIAELLAPGVFLIFIAIAAVLTGLAVLATGIELPFQLALFALFSVGTTYAGRHWYKRNPVDSSDPKLNNRLARLVGETVVVVAAIENGRGRVRVGDGVWPARGPDAPEGARVRITGADGTCLIVEAAAPQLTQG